MIIGTHTAAPMLAALAVDAVRLRNGRERLFTRGRLFAIGLAGALPDVINPHLSLAARYSSWSHTIWFLTGAYLLYMIVSRRWFGPRFSLMAWWMWGATVAHLAADTISNGTRPFYPYGPVISYSLIPSTRWLFSDILFVSATFLLARWVARQSRSEGARRRSTKARLLGWGIASTLGVAAVVFLTPAVGWVKHTLRIDPASKLARTHTVRQSSDIEDLTPLVERFRGTSLLPCLSAVVLKDGRIVGEGIAGVKVAGGREAATLEDRFSLGSQTKPMTATLLAALIEEKRLSWTTTVSEALGGVVRQIDPGWRKITVEQLVTYRATTSAAIDSLGMIWPLLREKGTPGEQRLALLRAALAKPPMAVRGRDRGFLDVGYAIAGAMAERVTGEPWEQLMLRRVFAPLGASSIEFGLRESGEETRMRGHQADGTPGWWLKETVPAALGPSATVHLTMRDWARFVLAHVRGDRMNPRRDCILLNAKSYDKLHTAVSGYAMGWGATRHDWSGGRVGKPGRLTSTLYQVGDNILWHCLTWLAPEHDLAILVATNQSGRAAEMGTFQLTQALSRRYARQ